MIGSRIGQESLRFGLRTGLDGIYIYNFLSSHIYVYLLLLKNFFNTQIWIEAYLLWLSLIWIRFKAWDKPDFHRSAEDIAFAVAMFFQKRGSLQNYYMVCTLNFSLLSHIYIWQWIELIVAITPFLPVPWWNEFWSHLRWPIHHN